MAALGLITAAIACALDIAILKFSAIKFQWLAKNIGHCVANDCLISSFFLWIAIDVLLVTVAGAAVIYYAPVAQGSGIPEVS